MLLGLTVAAAHRAAREPVAALVRRVPARRTGWRLGLLDSAAVTAGAVDADLYAAAIEAGVSFYACANAGDPGQFEVMSTPRFLKLTAGARLVVV